MKNSDTKAMLINGTIQQLAFNDFKEKFYINVPDFLENATDRYDFDYFYAVMAEAFVKYDDLTIDGYKFFIMVCVTKNTRLHIR